MEFFDNIFIHKKKCFNHTSAKFESIGNEYHPHVVFVENKHDLMEYAGCRPQRAFQRSRLRMGEGCQYASHWQVLDGVGARFGGSHLPSCHRSRGSRLTPSILLPTWMATGTTFKHSN